MSSPKQLTYKINRKELENFMKTKNPTQTHTFFEESDWLADCLSCCDAFENKDENSESSQVTTAETNEAVGTSSNISSLIEDCFRIMEEFASNCWQDYSGRSDTMKDEPVKTEEM